MMKNNASPKVVIVGAGFAGLTAAQRLARLPVQVTIIDRKNHHTFQPLLYQVATAGLSPGEIAAPIRSILRGKDNVEVLLGEVIDFDIEQKKVISKLLITISSSSLPAQPMPISVTKNGSCSRPA
jgi:NADH dehydrogenase